MEPRGPQEFPDGYSRSLPLWLLLELSDPDPLPAWECSALKGQRSGKQRNVIPCFSISLCHRRRQSLGREEVVLESWIGDFRGKKQREFSHPRVPLQLQGRTRNAGTKTTGILLSFLWKSGEVDLPRQIHAVTLIPEEFPEEFHHSNEEL